MRTITEPQREIPVIDEADVVVVGGGTAGFMAATAAARTGASVILIERFGYLGGCLTTTYNTTPGRFFDTNKEQVIGGLLSACEDDDDDSDDAVAEAPDDDDDEEEIVEETDDEDVEPDDDGDDEEEEVEDDVLDVEDQPADRIIIALAQEPNQLSRFFSTQGGMWLSVFANEWMFVPNAEGEYEPVMAEEVPTLENGGISEDFMTITYKLKPDLVWSDGEPVTAEDLIFTWEAVNDPDSTPQAQGAFSSVESMEAIDDHTVEVRMAEVNPGHLDMWTPVLPAHVFDSTAVDIEHEYARLPLGTGPFVVTEWSAGDQMRFERNENYREEGKPHIESITVRITPERQAMLASFVNGEFDYIQFVTASDLPTLAGAAEDGRIQLLVDETPTQVEALWLNMSDQGDHSTPHPVLGDPAIREAMDYGVDRQLIIDEVLDGFAVPAGTLITSGEVTADIEAAPYDPDYAREVLDAAGWETGGDGIREKDGVRASVRFSTPTGDSVRELYQQIIQQNMLDIGLEFVIDNHPNTTLFGSWEEGGTRRRGDYDVMMSRTGGTIDPSVYLVNFTTDMLPTEENPGGNTFSHWSNPDFDEAFNEANATLDPDIRQEAFQRAAQIMADDRPFIPLYANIRATAHSNRLQGVELKYWQLESSALWDVQNWYVEE